jgi:hypothetical protein
MIESNKCLAIQNVDMKIVYSRKYEARYPANPVENPDRVRLPAQELEKIGYGFIEPDKCSLQDISRVQRRRLRIRMYSHFAQVMPKSRLHELPVSLSSGRTLQSRLLPATHIALPMKEHSSISFFSFFGHEPSSWLMRVSAAELPRLMPEG